MKIELWQSQEFEHAHEARALQALLTNLREQDWDEFCLVCANFFCAGEQIDLMVIKPRAVVVVELKDASGQVEGGENGDWVLMDSTGRRVAINPGRRNPYQQARAMRYAVAQFLSEHASGFMPLQKSIQLDFMHVVAIVCFTECDPGSRLDLPHTPWFSVVGLDQLVEEIEVQRSPRLSFTHKEATALVRDVLRLYRVEIEPAPAEMLEARPELPSEELVAEAVVEAEMPATLAPCIVCGDEHTCAIPYLSGCLISSSQGRPLEELDLVVFDVETTGIDPGTGDRVVEVAAIKVSKGVVSSEFRELVNSGVPVGETVNVHGYTDEFLRRHGKPPEEVFPRFVDFIGGDILVAHNLPFDWSFVNSELALLGMPPMQNATINTLDLAERLLPHLPNRKLGTVCQYFEIPLDDAHHALPDVNGTWRILEELSRIVENAGGCVDPERTIRFASTQGHNYDIRMINHWADVPHQAQLLRDSPVLRGQEPEVLVALHHLIPDPRTPGRLLAGHESLVVIEPDWLVNVRSLVVVGRCEREYLVGRFTPREPSEAMLIGALAHGCFEAILRDPEDEKGLGDAFHQGARDRALDLITLGSDEESMATGVRPHAKTLVRWAGEMPFPGERSPETFVFSPQLGLKGRIDALWKDEDGHPTGLVELKTGRPSWYEEPWPGDALQAAAYALMLKARDPSSEIEPSIVLYTGGRQPRDGSGTEKIVRLTPEMAARAVAARNGVLVADYCLDMVDSRIPGCPRCWSKEGCSILSLIIDAWREIEPPDGLELPSFDDEDRRFFMHYATLLAREYKAFKDGHKTLWRDDPKKREEEGTAVYVPEIGEPEAVEGGFLYHMACDNRSELREGEYVVASDGDVAGSAGLATGTVQAVSRAGIVIRTRSRLTFDSAWIDGYSGERLLESDFQSLYDWMVCKPPPARRMVIGGDTVPRFGKPPEMAFKLRMGDKPLNEKQREALSGAMAMEEYLLVEGPPGSGKTVLIGALVRAFMQRGDRVLLAANTNQALDQAILALMDQGLGDYVVRLGREVSVTDERVKSRLLEVLADSADRSHYIEEFKELLEATPVVAATVAGWQTFPRSLAQGLFDIAIVDEATQITVPSALGVLRHVDRFILLGDPNQLPPVVLHEEAEGEEEKASRQDSIDVEETSYTWSPLHRSLFEILLERLQQFGPTDGVVGLEEQYRMNETICRFPSKQWYGGKLRPAGKAVGRRELAMLLEPSGGQWSEVLSPEKHVAIIDVPGSAEAGYMPRTNAAEARVACEIVLAARRAGASEEDIAVITPYRAQVARIRRELEKAGQGVLSGDQIRGMVDTVDRFQGEERPMVIVSFSTYGRTLSDHLKNERRLNVAFTRAKHKLILIGDHQVLSQDELLASLFSQAAEKDVHTIVKRWIPPDEGFKAF